MRLFEKHPALRWAVPGAVVAVVLGAGSAVGMLSAAADDTLAPRTAAQLLADVRQAKFVGVSGTVRQSADLGLPQLPHPAGEGSFSPVSLLSGNHTLRVWYAGPDKARVALMGTLGEYDLIRNGDDIWTWDSDKNEATHHRATEPGTHPMPAPTATMPRTPQEAAEQLLKAVDPTTTVSADSSVKVAGRNAYELVLAPKDTGSLVGSVRIAIDGVERIPVRVQVFAKAAAAPAIEIGFTSVSFARPDDAQFVFTPPPGAKVIEKGAGAERVPGGSVPDMPEADSQFRQEPSILGEGWTTVLVGKLPMKLIASEGEGASPEGAQLGQIFNALPRVSGEWGSGRLLSGKLFSVLLTDDGRLLAGAVSPERLYAVAR
ncbi:MAG: hypothetical protein H0T78_01075 [Longispora sp.]|nr:hypothetical protein [Longispora sp. (in: high G+C Gram-positive bacteria)]